MHLQMKTIKAEVLKKTKKEILLQQVDILFNSRMDFADNVKNWEDSQLCFYLKNIIQGIPFISDCTILSQEEIEQYYPTSESRIKFYNSAPANYWTKTRKDEMAYAYYKCIDHYGRLVWLSPEITQGVSPAYIIKMPQDIFCLE